MNINSSSIHKQTKPMHKHEVVLPIVVNGKSFQCDSNRMWNLTEMHKELNLPDAKSPRNWRSRIRTHFDNRANLRSSEGGAGGGTWEIGRAHV